MQVRPSNSLLHALSRFGEGAPPVRQPATPDAASQPGAAAATARGVPADAARAAARAAFQALKAPAPVVQAATQAATQGLAQPNAAAATAPASAQAKILPRGSFLNLVV